MGKIFETKNGQQYNKTMKNPVKPGKQSNVTKENPVKPIIAE